MKIDFGIMAKWVLTKVTSCTEAPLLLTMDHARKSLLQRASLDAQDLRFYGISVDVFSSAVKCAIETAGVISLTGINKMA